MREKELRIALVCFGGVSLAVYMHGITKEILKLVVEALTPAQRAFVAQINGFLPAGWEQWVPAAERAETEVAIAQARRAAPASGN